MKTILVATDFSKAANNAVQYAAKLAAQQKAKLILINAFAIPLGGYDSMAPMESISSIKDYALKELTKLMNEILNHHKHLEVECSVELGNPVVVITDLALQLKPDLIVMGIIGEAGALKKHLIGSSTLRIARKGTCPVLIVPESCLYHPIHNITFACDLDKIEEGKLLKSVKHFTKLLDGNLEIITVNKQSPDEKQIETYQFIDKKLADIKHKLVSINDDHTSTALEYYFKIHPSDLIIVNPKKHRFFERLFSESVTNHLAFTVSLPLLVIHS